MRREWQDRKVCSATDARQHDIDHAEGKGPELFERAHVEIRDELFTREALNLVTSDRERELELMVTVIDFSPLGDL